MGGVSFLIMLAGFAGLLYWYVLNLEKGTNGTSGFLGLKEDESDPEKGAEEVITPAFSDEEIKERHEVKPDRNAKWQPREKSKAYQKRSKP